MKHDETMNSLGKETLTGMLRSMHEIRQFEEKIRFLFLEGKMPGTVHQYIGMEACAVGVCTALEKDDVIASTHRPHGHAIARGVSLDSIMGELYGKTTGCCGGKGGSMHVGVCRPQPSSMAAAFLTRAWAWMKAFRGGTASPMSISTIWSARMASSISTWSITRVSGFMVVSQSCCGFISPRPL